MLIKIDFENISNYDEFYFALKENLNLPEYFGNNLDALFDTICGDLEMPLQLIFINLNLDQLEYFDDLLTTLEEAEEENDDFRFSYFMTQYDDDYEDEQNDFDDEEPLDFF